MIVRFGRSRSSKVIDFDTNRKCVRDFLLVCHSNLRHILHRFRDIAGFFLCRDPTLYFTLILGVFRLTRSPILMSAYSRGRNLKLINCEIILRLNLR